MRAHDSQNDQEIVHSDVFRATERHLEPLFLARVLDFEELHVLNKGHWNGLSSRRLGCQLGSLGCLLSAWLAVATAGGVLAHGGEGYG